MTHVLALLALALDVIVRAWRIQLAAWTAGGALGFWPAVRLNLYGEAASTLTPNRLGGEAARFAGLTQAGLRSVTALVAVGVEVAAEWPVFLLMLLSLLLHYVPDWKSAAQTWLRRHVAGDLLVIEFAALAVLLVIYLTQRLVRAGAIRHRVRRQWRVALAHVRRAPLWAQAVNAVLTAISLAARALVLPALAWGMPDAPPFGQMFFGSLALIASPLLVPLPSGGGGIEVVFLSGFAGDFGSRGVSMLVWWRFYTVILLTAIGVYLMIHSLGSRAARELMTIGWRRKRPAPAEPQ
ncbi:MAG TPA: lysylphosphatidylglycerol synthase domain-containing protein [Gemmatimonadales bacterium]|nr:lysylphosphatidylglycerol synthase domain-containing protein [Gemmatimonadales bacterium]